MIGCSVRGTVTIEAPVGSTGREASGVESTPPRTWGPRMWSVSVRANSDREPTAGKTLTTTSSPAGSIPETGTPIWESVLGVGHVVWEARWMAGRGVSARTGGALMRRATRRPAKARTRVTLTVTG